MQTATVNAEFACEMRYSALLRVLSGLRCIEEIKPHFLNFVKICRATGTTHIHETANVWWTFPDFTLS